MRLSAKWKKIIFWIVLVFVFIRIGYIVCLGEIDKEYYTSAVNDLTAATETACRNIDVYFRSDQSRLNSLEFVFDNIPEDKVGAIVVKISNEDELLYQSNISLENVSNREWHKVYVNAELEPGREYCINLSANEECTQLPDILFVSAGASPEIVSSYTEGREVKENLAIRFGYLESPGILERAVATSLWLWFVVVVYLLLYYSEIIREGIEKLICYFNNKIGLKLFWIVTELLACLVLLSTSGIEFQEPTKVVFVILSLISAIDCAEKKSTVGHMANTALKKVLLYLLYLYAAFSLVGQRIFVYPLTIKVTISGLFVFFIAAIWVCPVVNTLIYCGEKLSTVLFFDRKQIKPLFFGALCLLFLLLPAVYNLIANNPGISTVDTLSCMVTNAKNLHGMSEWHPFFYCLILRIIQKIWDSTYAVILVQYFFWAYVMLELLFYLRKKGMQDMVLFCVALFSGFNAGNFIHLNTIWKDIPYALSLFWAFIILAKLSLDDKEYCTRWYIYLELAISLVGVCLYRKNGIVAFILIVAAMLIVLRKNKRIWISVGATFVAIFIIQGPVSDYFEVVNPGRFGSYIGLSQDILGVYYAGGEVSESTLQMINVMTDYNNAEYDYTPTWSNQSYNLAVKPKEFIINYINTFLKNPVTMIRTVIAREDAIWNIFPGEDAVLGCVNHTGTMDYDTEWAAYYPKREFVNIYPWMSAATAYTANTQWISAIEWRCGVFTLLGLISAVWLIIRSGMKKHLLMLTPIIGQILSLLLSTGWSDFRYFWPLNLMNMGVILFSIVVLRRENRNKQGVIEV